MKPTVIARAILLACVLSTGSLADDLLQPGDRVLAVGRRLASNSGYPEAEAPPFILDSDLGTKYLNFAGAETGFIITLAGGPDAVRSIEIATANDAEERDPTAFVLYGSNDAITSADNSDGMGETWTEIGSGPLDLPGVRGAWATPVNVANDIAYASYKLIFPTLKGGPLMQVAEVEFYNLPGGLVGGGTLLTSPGAAIIAVQDPVPTSNYPGLEGPSRVIDGAADSKYLNFGKEETGFIVVPSLGLTRIESFVLTTANDFDVRDPASYELYGTVDDIVSQDNSVGEDENWELIASGPLSLPTERETAGTSVVVNATADYSAYKVIFPTLKNSADPDATSIQLAEAQFSGVVFSPPQGELLITQGDRVVAIDTDMGSRSNYPDAEAPWWALDGWSDTKYLNFGGTGTGFIVSPGALTSTVRSFQITTGGDAPERDPSAWALYGTGDAITSADNSTGEAENWTLIATGTVDLPDERETLGPVVAIANETPYGSYRMYFTELKGGAPLMQIAEIQFYEDAAGIGPGVLGPNNPIIAVQNPVALSGYGGGEGSPRAVDGDANSKYLNNGGQNSGFIVMPTAPATVVQRFSITTGNDAENRDPATYELYGSMDPLMSGDNSTGEAESWTLIDTGALTLPSGRGVASDSVVVQNTLTYRTYKMLFPTIKDTGPGDLMQIAEIQLRGDVIDPGPATVLGPDDAILAVNPRDPEAITSYPDAESPAMILDGNTGTKYLNYGGRDTGFIVTPGIGSSTVRSFQITTANDASERDPTEWALYGTDDPITSPDNSTGTEENWTPIATGTVALPDERQVLGPVVAVANETAFTSYRMVFTGLRDNNSIMQIADVQFFDDAVGAGSLILAATDAILAIGERVQIVSNYPQFEAPARILDGLIGTKYFNGGGPESGFIVTPAAGPSVVTGLVLRSANDFPDRDPVTYELYGTVDPITTPDNGQGTNETWTLISSGDVNLPDTRFQTGDVVTFANTETYTSYMMIFVTLRGGTTMQVAEAQFFGTAITTDYQVLGLSQDGANLTLQWGSEADVEYEIYYSPDQTDWSQKLAGTVTGTATSTEHTFANPMPAANALSFRINRP